MTKYHRQRTWPYVFGYLLAVLVVIGLIIAIYGLFTICLMTIWNFLALWWHWPQMPFPIALACIFFLGIFTFPHALASALVKTYSTRS